ncbi:hypothetical protein A6A03_03480 [Chloroflexus islandicus]|uniref:WYL domain-containing protein n=1 Tax=Chloroflexus islandicus TaxID=1707952 RepID=A0A178M7M4_9CHLR|nr:WYL domain-containing protein [Chloroflexus islandicus]OAN44217.1 hypothetical protein A6A03_03480 [Chloroflexus islandicus]
MVRWAVYLAETPVVLQRLIAATQRVRWPHRADAAARVAALRAALCRPAAVRACYFALAPEAQAAVQVLRRRRGVLSPAAAEQLLGPIRPLRQLRRDRRPRSIGETLLLLGWLLPRPARPRHPAGWVLAPELRRWLPEPLPEVAAPCALPSAHVPAALAAASTLLAVAATQPLPVRASGLLASAALRRLRAVASTFTDDLWQWLAPLLVDVGALRLAGQTLRPGPALAQFAGAAATTQLALLRAAWEHQPRPDRWLVRLRLSMRGLDWPALRRRLLHWGEAMAAQQLAADAAFVALTKAVGPLVDGTTHSLWPVRRAPWLRRGQQQAWRAAVAGPLAWLGVVAPFALPQPQPWQYDELTRQVIIPTATLAADLPALQPWAALVRVDQTMARWQITPATIRRGLAAGHDPGALRDLWRQRLGSDPPAWMLPAASPPVQIVTRALALCATPATLAAAVRSPAVRRALAMQVAPGVALVAPGRERALARALARVGVAVVAEATRDQVASQPAGERWPAIESRDGVAERDEAVLLSQFAEVGDNELPATASVAVGERVDPVQPCQPLAVTLQMLRAAIRRRQAVQLRYQPPQQPAHERLVQPIRLEQHGDRWLLYAYCAMRRTERCFRVDRIIDLRSTLLPPANHRRQQGAARPKGRLALPAAPPNRIARVWLE